MEYAAATRRAQARQERRLRSLESRVDELEGDLGSVLAGGPPRPARPTRATLLSRWLIVGGALLIVAAVLLAMV